MMMKFTAGLAIAVLGLGALVAIKSIEERGLRAQIADHRACAVAVFGDDLAAADRKCPPEIAAVAREAVQAETCDAALLGADLFLIRSACSTEVKTLSAHREAETRRADSLAEVLKAERVGQAAAITRAEGRARTETERKLRAEAALQDAPRRPGPDGDLLVLDAGVLRRLRGDAAAD